MSEYLIKEDTLLQIIEPLKEKFAFKDIAKSLIEKRDKVLEVTIPDGVLHIRDNAFNNCINLTSVDIPEGVTSIGSNAFFNCRKLADITLPDTITKMDAAVFTNTAYYSDASNWEDGVLYNGALYIGKYFVDFGMRNNSLDSYTIKDGTLLICKGAFGNQENLNTINIPNSVKYIGDNAFYNCSSLTNITIPNGVTVLENYLLHRCSSLTNITIPNSVTSIGNSVFQECSSLTNITIPNSVKYIGNSVFLSCSNLTDVYMHPIIPPTLYSMNCFGLASNITFHVPIGSGNAYKSATNWSYYASKIVEDIEIVE